MDISIEYIKLFTDIAEQIDFPKVEGIYLPHLVDENIKKKDEFGVVILEDGSAGAFYISLDDTLEQLQTHLENTNTNIKSNNKYEKRDALSLIQKFKKYFAA